MADEYTVVELGTFGGDYSEAFAINDMTQIVGRAARPFVGSSACLWQPWAEYEPFNLGAAWTSPVNPLELTSVATGISVKGKIVGSTQKSNPENQHALFYDGGVIEDLTSVLGKSGSHATDINASNVVVGTMGQEPGSWDAFVCDLKPGGVTTIITGPGTAKAVNALGQVAGVEYDSSYGGWQAFIYHNGQITYITPGPGNVGNAVDINNSGQVVGEFNFNPFIYSPGGEGLKILDVPLGIATGINDSGHVVGYKYTSGENEAWIFTPQDGVVMLDTLIPSDSGWKLSQATDINLDGYIVGVGQHNGKRRGFLLVPVTVEGPRWWTPFEVAIDPMALLLLGNAYYIWVQIHHPHEPKEKLQQMLRSLTIEDRRAVLGRATTLVEYGKSLELQVAHRGAHGLAKLHEALLSITDKQRQDVLARAKAVLEAGRGLDTSSS